MKCGKEKQTIMTRWIRLKILGLVLTKFERR